MPDVSTFYLNKINDIGVKQQNQVKISNSSAILKNLVSDVSINEATSCIQNINTSYKRV